MSTTPLAPSFSSHPSSVSMATTASSSEGAPPARPPRPREWTTAPAGTAASATSSPLTFVDELLRSPSAVLDRIERGQDLPAMARTMLLTIAVGAGAFGAALGVHRGGLQIPYAAVKLPLVVLLTAALSAPVLSALRNALTGRWDVARDLALLLATLARTSILLAGLTPAILFAVSVDAPYHGLILWGVASGAAAGVVGVTLLVQGIRRVAGESLVPIAAVVLLVAALVGAQMSWTLRPWVLRPRTPEVVFVRSLEGSFLEAVGQSLQSSRGVYTREAAPLPEADAPRRTP